MDMRRHLIRLITLSVLEEMGDRYEGVIAEVIEEPVRNKFKGTKNLEPVIVFGDGWRYVPNIAARRALIGFWGSETDDWIGRRLIVFRTPMQRKDAKSETTITRWEKRVMLPLGSGRS